MPQSQSLIEETIDNLLQKLIMLENKLEKKGRYRKISAYGLKIIVVLGGFLIAFNDFPEYSRYFGGATTVAISLDWITANHTRLIGEQKACYAAKAARLRIGGDYTRALNPLIRDLNNFDKNSQDYERTFNKVEKLQERTHKELQDVVSEIERHLADLDLIALDNISLRAARASQTNDNSTG